MTDEPPPGASARAPVRPSVIAPPVTDPVLEVLLGVDEDVAAEVADAPPSLSFLVTWATRALGAAERGPAERGPTDPESRHELSVRLVSAATMRELNRAWRGRDRATNVLSFPAGLPALPLDDGAFVHALGDIVLCPVIIAREARDQGKAVEAHWAHLVVHGVLHLCGLDHEEEDEALDMEALERRLLGDGGVADPYAERTAERTARRTASGFPDERRS